MPAWCGIETKGEKKNEPCKHETFRDNGTDRPYKLGQSKRRSGEGFDLVNCEEAVKMFGRCEGVPAAWAPCQKCEFFKERKKGE